MIVLDTNVISEAMRPEPDACVRQWLNSQSSQALYLSSVTLAELLFGIRLLPPGKRKNTLDLHMGVLVGPFKGRVLPFDAAAARHYADLATMARYSGRSLPRPDSYIAAIASSRGFIVATRDTAPFEAVGVSVINPWGSSTI